MFGLSELVDDEMSTVANSMLLGACLCFCTRLLGLGFLIRVGRCVVGRNVVHKIRSSMCRFQVRIKGISWLSSELSSNIWKY